MLADLAWSKSGQAAVNGQGTTRGLQVLVFDLAAGAGNVDVTVQDEFEVVDIVTRKSGGAGGAGDTVQLLKSANAVSNAISLNAAVGTIARAGTLDATYATFSAGDTLRLTKVQGGANAACFVTLFVVPRAS